VGAKSNEDSTQGNIALLLILLPLIAAYSDDHHHHLHLHLAMCGILALLLSSQSASAAPEINEALSLLQHRGQDAAGIVTCGPGGRFYQCKANGMVRDVFDSNSLARLRGSMGVGHGESSRKP
jgi:hypothetical protein